jgi:hypothetical protein
MASGRFTVLVRGADELRYYHFDGPAADELKRLSETGRLDRGDGARRLEALLGARAPDYVDLADAELRGSVDFDTISDGELRQWMSRRLLERRRRVENS